MKSGIFVGALVVLVCHASVCFGKVELSGKCQLEDIPANLHDKCIRAECVEKEDGTFEVATLECPTQLCGDDLVGTWSEADNSKTFPDCCALLTCH